MRYLRLNHKLIFLSSFLFFTSMTRIVWILCPIITTVHAQFGLGNKKRGTGSTFEELNELAKEQLDNLKYPRKKNKKDKNSMYENWDVNELTKLMEDAMKDPAAIEYMEQITQNVGDVLSQLRSMTPEQIQEQITQGLAQITEPAVLDNILEQKETVLNTLIEQGLITSEKAAEYRSNPALFEKEISKAFEDMKNIFSDPDALRAAMQVMKGMGDIMKDPEGALKSFSRNALDAVSDAFSQSDDQIEEARLKILQDPTAMGNPALAAMFEDEEMQSILRDPVKWREQVKKGQSMLLQDDDDGNDEL